MPIKFSRNICYSDDWYHGTGHLNKEQVKVHYVDVSGIQMFKIQILTVYSKSKMCFIIPPYSKENLKVDLIIGG